MLAQSTDGRRDRQVVVVEHDQQGQIRVAAGVVHRFVGHAATQGPVADHRNAMPSPWAMPSIAEIEVPACAVPKLSYSDSCRRGKPDIPPNCRIPAMAWRRPVSILCG